MPRIVALGDSTTNCVAKSQVTEETAWRCLLARDLAGRLGEPVEVINAGVDADVSTLALARLGPDVLERRPDCAIVLLGTNDAGYFRPPDGVADSPRVPLEEFRTTMRRIIRRILDSGAAVVLCTSVPMSAHYWLADLPAYRASGLNFLVAQYAEAVRDLAAQFELRLADVFEAFQQHPARDHLIPDGIHPNAAGQRLIADTLLPAVAAALRETPA